MFSMKNLRILSLKFANIIIWVEKGEFCFNKDSKG